MKNSIREMLQIGSVGRMFEGDAGDGGTGGDGGDNGATEVFNFKDPQTHSEIELPKKVGDVDLQVLVGHIIGKSNKDADKRAEAKYQKLVKEIQSKSDGQFSELQAKVDELEMEKLTDQERAEKMAQKKVNEANAKNEELAFYAQTNWDLFKENKIDNDMFMALSKHDLYNPDQTRMILKQLARADLAPDNDTYKTVMQLNIDGELKDMSPEEAGDHFLAQPENANHLKNNLRSGSGTTPGNSGRMSGDGTIRYTRTSMQDDAVRKEYNKKLQNREPVVIVDE